MVPVVTVAIGVVGPADIHGVIGGDMETVLVVDIIRGGRKEGYRTLPTKLLSTF